MRPRFRTAWFVFVSVLVAGRMAGAGVYTREAGWVESMCATREAWLTPPQVGEAGKAPAGEGALSGGDWQQCAADFPAECGWFSEDLPNGTNLWWFAGRADAEMERGLVDRALQDTAPFDRPLREECRAMFEQGVPPGDRRWLDLYVQGRRLREDCVKVRRFDIDALRRATTEAIATFGPRYPNGPRILERLAELDQSLRAGGGGAVPPRQRVETARSLLSEALLTHPLLNFDKLLFLTRTSWQASHIYSEHRDGNHTPGGNLCVLSPVAPDGKVTELVPELTNGVFGQFDLSFDARKVVFAYKRNGGTGYRIYELDIDPSPPRQSSAPARLMAPGSLRQLTFDGDEEVMRERYKGSCYGCYDDVDPCYLPDGRIVFASSRSQRAVACFPTTVTTLYVMDADGRNMRRLSSGQFTELDPCVMNDGRVLYMRWEYVDKGFGNAQSLWSMHPDGSYPDHVYKNSVVVPAGMVDARPIPGCERIVTVGAPHCGEPIGPVILVDNRASRTAAEAMTNITPEIGYPNMFQIAKGKGFFKQPYPLSETLFLVSHDPQVEKDGHYGIYVLDVWGNRTKLYRDPALSCYLPVPLRPRPRPTAIAAIPGLDRPAEGRAATLFIQDVYRGMTGIERGRVKYVRVVEVMPTTWEQGLRAGRQGDTAGLQSAAVSYKADVARKRVLGVATVHEDGSARFTVPPGANLFFQALDEDYMELQRMRTFINLMPGEVRSCIGCHEPRRTAPGAAGARPMAMDHPVQTLTPQPGDHGVRVVHYSLDVQPTLDRHCLGCHSGRQPRGDLALTGEATTMWNRSYESLIDKGLVSQLNGGYGAAYIVATPPLAFGSHRSKLVERIRKDPCKAGLTREEFVRIVTWIDTNVPFYGTHQGKKHIQWQAEPDFRPLPSAADHRGS